MRGIVLKIDKNSAVVLNNNGEYSSIPAKFDWQVGDIVKSSATKKRSFRSLSVLVASLVLVIVMGVGAFSFYNKEVALISIDSNTSVEIGINRLGRVVSVADYDDSDISGCLNKKYLQAIDELIDNSKLANDDDDDNYLLVSVQAKNQTEQENILFSIESHCSEKYTQIQSEFMPVDESNVNNAHENGMSVGKYSKLTELKEYEEGLDIKESAGETTSDIVKEIEDHHAIKAQENTPDQQKNHAQPDSQETGEHEKSDHH